MIFLKIIIFLLNVGNDFYLKKVVLFFGFVFLE